MTPVRRTQLLAAMSAWTTAAGAVLPEGVLVKFGGGVVCANLVLAAVVLGWRVEELDVSDIGILPLSRAGLTAAAGFVLVGGGSIGLLLLGATWAS